MNKPKTVSFRMEEYEREKMEAQAKKEGYKTVSEYVRDRVKEMENPLLRQHEREKIVGVICRIETRLQEHGVCDPELRRELQQIKEAIR